MHRVLASLIALACAGCQAQADPAAEHSRHEEHVGKHGSHARHHQHSGASEDGAVVSLDLEAADGAVHLLLGQRRADGVTCSYLRSRDGLNWSDAVTVDAGVAPIVALGNDAQIAARDGTVTCVWSGSGSGWGGSGPLVVAVSDDGGRNWEPGGRPHDDGRDDGHGFADLAYDGDGRLHAVWLDGRDGSRGLRHARSHDAGRSWSANLTVDAETCECCWNVLLSDPSGGMWTLYRDREPRDMAIARWDPHADAWTRLNGVGEFDWQFDGCPHQGGGLARTVDGALYALVWSGADAELGMHGLRSVDGTMWTAVPALRGRQASRVRLAAALDGSTLAAVWTELRDGRPVVWAGTSGDSGRSWSAPTMLSEHGDADHPRVAALSDGFAVVWVHNGTQWRSAMLQRP